MNKKGQALVEFIIIVPIVVMIFLGIIDYIMIFSAKNNLENKISEVVKIYHEYNDENEIKNYLSASKDDKSINYNIKQDDKYVTISLEENYEFITPGLSKIMPSPFILKTERVLLNE